MEELACLLNKLNTPTTNLPLVVIQELLLKARHKNLSRREEELWTEILDKVWIHVSKGLLSFDDQLLCATCFYTVLCMTKKQEVLLEEIKELINYEITLRRSNCIVARDSKMSQTVSLMYGMFQSAFLIHDSTKDIPNVMQVLQVAEDLLMLMAYDYSRYTFLIFKTINAFTKILGTAFQDTIYSKTNLKRLLNLVNHNWENPITGVRDLNKSIFRTVVSLLDKCLYESVLNDINSFQWNKAKYLMLSEIIQQHKNNVINFTQHSNNWVEGILYSLQKPGLVSAGADMYFAILKNLQCEDDWCTLFLKESVKILLGKSNKAIENFCNYWCLTTFKRFPQLLKTLVHEISKKCNLNLYSLLCIMKQGSKLGLLHNKQPHKLYNDTKRYVMDGLEHRDPNIRMLAFEITLTGQGKAKNECNELKHIIDYLVNNINSDCTVLRISMLHNFKDFITRLSKLSQNFSGDNMDEIEEFYTKLQELIVQSLNLHGNYQRKITTIKLCNILLSSFDIKIKKPKKGRKVQTASTFSNLREKYCLVLFAEDFIKILFNLLKDPAEDIRENTIQLILDHYSGQIAPKNINYLIDDAQNGIQSKFFFQINCGHSTFRLLASLFIKASYTDTTFKCVNDIFCYAYNELCTEYNKKRNIVKSIEAGKQLHSLLGVLLEVLKILKLNSYTNSKDVQATIPQLINMLEDIAGQFSWEEETSTSSDFSKMNEMIQNLIISSGYNPMEEKDSIKISGLEQIVLNCLWFNVKASCDLASFLIQFLDDQQNSECERCLSIMMHVLETSRHKGAIEAAGAALGRSIQYLTGLSEDRLLSHIPLALLKCKLKELISLASMASVTRRGAGLSIMVHRIVSSDMKKGRPLFHYFMETILKTCSNTKEFENTNETQKDLPKAIYIHFLTRIVIDSSLAAEMMYYSAELAEIAFENLVSPHWQIRNAALQLYGALIPKLIGQKKASGTGDETIATVASDEFRTHSPKLWKHITESLQYMDQPKDIVQAHSNILPILNVLANLARRYNFSFNTTDNDQQLLENLILLLGSPIFTVRRLSAKCIFNIYDFESIYDMIVVKEIKSENQLHGSLILIIHCLKNYSLPIYQKQIDKLLKKYTLLMQGIHSYICRQQFEELLGRNHIVNEIQGSLKEVKHNNHAPGVSHWANCRLREYICHCSWEDIPAALETLLKERNFDQYCDFILDKMQVENVSKDVLEKIATILLEFKNISESTVIWKILYQISLTVELNANLLPVSLFECLGSRGFTYGRRYVIPVLANFAGKLTNEHLVKLSNIIFTLSDPGANDVDMRFVAALANNAISKSFTEMSSTVKINSIKTLIVLLQDEDEDIRVKSTEFYKNVSNNDVSCQSYICISKILSKEFLRHILDNPEKEIPILCKEIETILSSYTIKDINNYNPFSNESKNIYFETEVVRQHLTKLQMIFE